MSWGLGSSATAFDSRPALQRGYGPAAGGQNLAHFDNAEFNRIYDRIRATPNGPERLALIHEATRIWTAYVPYKVHVHRIFTDMWHPWVSNYVRHPFQYRFWEHIDVDTDSPGAGRLNFCSITADESPRLSESRRGRRGQRVLELARGKAQQRQDAARLLPNSRNRLRPGTDAGLLLKHRSSATSSMRHCATTSWRGRFVWCRIPPLRCRRFRMTSARSLFDLRPASFFRTTLRSKASGVS